MQIMDMNTANTAFMTGAGRGERLIGTILMETGKLSADDTESILRLQEQEDIRFGEAGQKLGVLSHDDIQFALAHQYGYPYLDRDDGRVSQELVAAYQPFSPQAEALRALRSQLKMRWFTGARERRTLAVISNEPGSGRSYLAANLAIAFAQLGDRTLLIDADLRNPRQHALFHLDNRSGLSSLLANRGVHAGIRRIASFLDLHSLSAGPTPPNPQELLGRPAFDRLLDEVTQEFDVILIDTPAAGAYADAQIIAAKAGGALITTRKNRTKLDETKQMCMNFANLGVMMVGTVMSEF
jgi:protein-tyrosine kinase